MSCYFDGCTKFITHRFPETDVVGMCTEHARTVLEPEKLVPADDVCHFCGEIGNATIGHAIHRDGFDEGPQVPLCDACGGQATPTCEEIWDRIAVVKPEPTPEPPRAQIIDLFGALKRSLR